MDGGRERDEPYRPGFRAGAMPYEPVTWDRKTGRNRPPPKPPMEGRDLCPCCAFALVVGLVVGFVLGLFLAWVAP